MKKVDQGQLEKLQGGIGGRTCGILAALVTSPAGFFIGIRYSSELLECWNS